MNSHSVTQVMRFKLIQGLSWVFPEYFGAIGTRLFLQPQRAAPVTRWQDAFADFDKSVIEVQGLRIPFWHKGSGPQILLVHGWENDHFALGGFVQPLLDQGYSVAALDLPAHGEADGKDAPLPLMAQAIAAVGQALPALHAVIAHSVGGATSVLAMEEYALKASRLVLIGAPQAASKQAIGQALASGLSSRAIKRMERQLQHRLAAPLEHFQVDRGLGRIDCQVLLVHAHDDRVVPIRAAQKNAAARASQTLWLDQGGHNRPLGDPLVIGSVIDFLKISRRKNRHPSGLRYHPRFAQPVVQNSVPQSAEQSYAGLSQAEPS
ncbi:alpha/beta fold hydrolase [Halopseudomonas laoshanensis]|uniref:alpha/beta fold hydrolase n=1 Tax=Halopseudomonas laoshanensis TaxID=2268758 RepID=UPI0037369EF5